LQSFEHKTVLQSFHGDKLTSICYQSSVFFDFTAFATGVLAIVSVFVSGYGRGSQKGDSG
jgi:hypothetical protein